MYRPLTVLVLILFYSAGTPEMFGYHDGCQPYRHFVYMFQHNGFLHLLLNSAAFVSLSGAVHRFHKPCLFLPYAYLAGVVSSFVAPYALPCVGMSGVCHCLLGMYAFHLVRSVRRWLKDRRRNEKNLMRSAVFFTAVLAAFSFSAVLGNSATMLHVSCLLLGACFPLFGKRMA